MTTKPTWTGRSNSSRPASIRGILTPEQKEAYALTFAINEIAAKLDNNDILPSSGNRSPSPPPEYDTFGKRTNTREARHRQRLEVAQTEFVERALAIIPGFVPPRRFKRYRKTQEKVFLPVYKYADINFVGLLLGPRGKTLQRMERESGAKISIRGKGSVKTGSSAAPNAIDTMSEDLHCIVSADSPEKIQKGIKLINEVVDTAVSLPEHQNELKRGQLRELATLNGTLRAEDPRVCLLCGEAGHLRYNCPQAERYGNSIICQNCGAMGHVSRDCTQPKGRKQELEHEYEKLMAELRPGIARTESGGSPHRHGPPEDPGLDALAPGLDVPPGLDVGLNAPGLDAPPGLDVPGLDAPPVLDDPPPSIDIKPPPGLEAPQPPPGLEAPQPPPGLEAPQPPPGLDLTVPPPPGLDPGAPQPPPDFEIPQPPPLEAPQPDLTAPLPLEVPPSDVPQINDSSTDTNGKLPPPPPPPPSGEIETKDA